MGATRGRGPATVVVLAAAVVLVVGGVLFYRYLTRPDGPDTLIVGDSVTYLSAGYIDRAVGHGTFGLIAEPGYRSVDLLGPMRAWMGRKTGAGGRLHRVALLVGYNDVLRNTEGSPSLPPMVRESSKFDCAVWLELPARPGGNPSNNPKFPSDRVDLWNRRLRAEAADHPNVHVASDWKDAVERNRSVPLVIPDDVHPSIPGRRRLADAYRAALERTCP